MKSIFLHFSLLICVSQTALAQFHPILLTGHCETVKSVFTKVHVINNLEDEQLLGFVQKGAFNKRQEIRYDGKGSIADAVAKFFISTEPSSLERPQELVLVLNELFMSETTGDFSETGRLKLSLRLFSELHGKYSELFALDSIYTYKGLDVTKKLLGSMNEELCVIVNKAVIAQRDLNTGTVQYSMEELYKLDSLEKLTIPFYSTSTPAMGIYKDYKSLKLNTPDSSKIVVDASDLRKIKVFKIYKKGRKIKLESEGMYAVSDGKNLYKATAKNFYEIRKEGMDFYYDRPASIAESNSAGVLAAGAAFGLMGSLIMSGASGNRVNWYKFKINYRRGNSIPISVVE